MGIFADVFVTNDVDFKKMMENLEKAIDTRLDEIEDSEKNGNANDES